MRRRAWTLIELLIVVAIIAILSAGAMALLMAPLKQDVFASAESEFQRGTSALMPALVEDVHGAARVESQDMEGSASLTLLMRADGGGAFYLVDEKGALRRGEADAALMKELLVEPLRASVAASAMLLASVKEFSLEEVEKGRAVRVRLEADRRVLDRQLGVRREVVLNLGGRL